MSIDAAAQPFHKAYFSNLNLSPVSLEPEGLKQSNNRVTKRVWGRLKCNSNTEIVTIVT